LVYKKLNTFVLSSQDIYSILEFFTLWQSKWRCSKSEKNKVY
jgi:hypothetical protein